VDGASATTDGRVRRGERNRNALVDALLALIEDGELQPSAPRVAERAGLSLRTVFQHFADMESLYATLADRQTRRVTALLTPLPDRSAPLARRVDALLDQRAALYEAIAPVRRAALLVAHRSPELQTRLATFGRFLRRQVAQTFAPELDAVRSDRRTELLAALDVATSWEAWDQLRTAQRRSVGTAKRATRVLVVAAVGTM
jgi:AcrR family transcriptional regulator